MRTKRLLGLLLALSMLASIIPVGFAASPADFVDFPTGWSNAAMQAAVNNGLLYGFDNGEIRPQANLTRAEMAAVITRSFGAVTKADISTYSDVSPSAWYYDSIAKAVKMGAMHGISSIEIAPENPITREELFTVFARVLVLSSANTAVLDKFGDASEISLWAKEHMAALVERGYINGDELGNVNPKANITREEFAQVMHNAIRTYIAKPGTYTADMEGITVIRVPDVTVKDLENTSDLVIGDGVGTGNIYITNVKIGQRLLARGGTITIKNTTLGDKVVVNNVNGTTHFNNYRTDKVFKNIVENTKATFLTLGGGSNGTSSPSKTATVNFYNGYPGLILIKDKSVNIGETLDKDDIPAIEASDIKSGYIEDDDLADVYSDNEYTHKITPSYWYINSKNEFVPFDETVVIEGDTDVFLLTKMFVLSLKFDSMSQPLSLLAYYNNDTRLANSLKDILYDGRQKADKANQFIPKYDEITDKLKDKLAAADLIDSNDNIKYFNFSLPISKLVKETTVRNMVREHIEDVIMGRDTNIDDVYSFIKSMNMPNMSNDVEIQAYIDTLSLNDKLSLAAYIYDHKESYPAYDNFIESLMNDDEITINKNDTDIIINIAHAIEKLDFDKVMAESTDNALVNQLINLVGEDAFKNYFVMMRDNYAQGLIEAIESAENTNQNQIYTTHLSLKLNLVELIEEYYLKAQTKLVDKLETAGVKYNENKYLKYLAEHDAISKLLNKTTKTGELTGYQLKSVLEYYDYLLGLVMVADDALTYYGNLTQPEFEAVYDSVFLFLESVHSKLNGLIETYVAYGTLPSKVQSVVDNIKQINDMLSRYDSKIKSLLTKYLDSDINIKIENGTIKDDEKTVKISSILFGKEEPTVTLDTLYSIFYNYDDDIQAKLKELKDSGKLKEAVEKFENTSFGEIFKSQSQINSIAQKIDEIKNTGKVQSALDSLYQMFELIADNGIEIFKEATGDVTVIDSYKVKFESVTLTITRSYE